METREEPKPHARRGPGSLSPCDNLTGVLRVEITRLSSKGQIVLPKALRDASHWGPGTEFTVEAAKDGVFLRHVQSFPPTRLDDLVGCLPVKGKPRSIAEMHRAIAKGVKQRRDRGRY